MHILIKQEGEETKDILDVLNEELLINFRNIFNRHLTEPDEDRYNICAYVDIKGKSCLNIVYSVAVKDISLVKDVGIYFLKSVREHNPGIVSIRKKPSVSYYDGKFIISTRLASLNE